MSHIKIRISYTRDTDLKYELRRKSFRSDKTLRLEIERLVAPSYEDPTALIAREFEHCDTLYLARNENDCLISFFMVAWEGIKIRNALAPSVYLGLSATSQDTKNTGIVRQLYTNFISDGADWERRNNCRLLLWGTTATPSAFFAVQTLFAEAQPDLEGGFSFEAAEIALHLRQQLCFSVDRLDPFVLRGVALNTRYSPKELARIDLICKKRNFLLFERLGINERNGDRLLFICRIPQLTDERR